MGRSNLSQIRLLLAYSGTAAAMHCFSQGRSWVLVVTQSSARCDSPWIAAQGLHPGRETEWSFWNGTSTYVKYVTYAFTVFFSLGVTHTALSVWKRWNYLNCAETHYRDTDWNRNKQKKVLGGWFCVSPLYTLSSSCIHRILLWGNKCIFLTNTRRILKYNMGQ